MLKGIWYCGSGTFTQAKVLNTSIGNNCHHQLLMTTFLRPFYLSVNEKQPDVKIQMNRLRFVVLVNADSTASPGTSGDSSVLPA